MPLGRGIALHRAVPIQVIGRDIGDARDVRAARHQFQLERRQLHHHLVNRAHALHIADQRVTDVAAHPYAHGVTSGLLHTFESGAQHLTHQRGGGRLSGGTRDADDWRGTRVEENLRIVAQRYATSPRFQHNGQVNRHAATQA